MKQWMDKFKQIFGMKAMDVSTILKIFNTAVKLLNKSKQLNRKEVKKADKAISKLEQNKTKAQHEIIRAKLVAAKIRDIIGEV